MRVQFVNNNQLVVVGYIGNYPNVTEPATTGPIKPGSTGTIDVPGGNWTATIQLDGRPLTATSPQQDVMARTGGISGNVVIILDQFGRISVTQE